MSCKDKDGGTHHFACECREEHFKALEKKNAILLAALTRILDKWDKDWRTTDDMIHCQECGGTEIAKQAIAETNK